MPDQLASWKHFTSVSTSQLFCFHNNDPILQGCSLFFLGWITSGQLHWEVLSIKWIQVSFSTAKWSNSVHRKMAFSPKHNRSVLAPSSLAQLVCYVFKCVSHNTQLIHGHGHAKYLNILVLVVFFWGYGLHTDCTWGKISPPYHCDLDRGIRWDLLELHGSFQKKE